MNREFGSRRQNKHPKRAPLVVTAGFSALALLGCAGEADSSYQELDDLMLADIDYGEEELNPAAPASPEARQESARRILSEALLQQQATLEQTAYVVATVERLGRIADTLTLEEQLDLSLDVHVYENPEGELDKVEVWNQDVDASWAMSFEYDHTEGQRKLRFASLYTAGETGDSVLYLGDSVVVDVNGQSGRTSASDVVREVEQGNLGTASDMLQQLYGMEEAGNHIAAQVLGYFEERLAAPNS